MDAPLTGKQIINYMNGNINVILYSDLKNYNSIHHLLNKYGQIIILYFWKSKPSYYGHYITVFYNKNGNIEVFNSLGENFIDETLKNIDKKFKEQHNEDFKWLTYLLYNQPLKVEYNEKKLQSNTSATCGRFCLYRLKRKDLNIEEFQNLFNNIKTNDKKIISLINI